MSDAHTQRDDLVAGVAELRDPTQRYLAATRRISELQEAIRQLQEIRSLATAALHAEGLSYREIGERFGISTPRIAQLVNATGDSGPLIRGWAELERKLADLAALLAIPVSRRSPISVIEALWEAGHLTDAEKVELSAVRMARNDAAHARRTFERDEMGRLLDTVIHLSASLELKLAEARENEGAAISEDRAEAEALLRRVIQQHPDVAWQEGRCEECGRAIPVPSVGELWVCSRSCRERWFQKLHHFVAPGSEEEAITKVVQVVPYWI